jgi:hypothetical protein
MDFKILRGGQNKWYYSERVCCSSVVDSLGSSSKFSKGTCHRKRQPLIIASC